MVLIIFLSKLYCNESFFPFFLCNELNPILLFFHLRRLCLSFSYFTFSLVLSHSFSFMSRPFSFLFSYIIIILSLTLSIAFKFFYNSRTCTSTYILHPSLLGLSEMALLSAANRLTSGSDPGIFSWMFLVPLGHHSAA